MLVAWVVGVQVLAAAGDVGSVDGPQAFVETRAIVDNRLLEADRSFVDSVSLGSQFTVGVSVAQQARVSAGWGIPLGRHRLLPGVTWTPSVLLADASDPHFQRTPLVTFGLLEPALAAVFVTPAGVIRPRVSIPVPLGEPWSWGARLDVQFRRALAERVFVGLSVDAFVARPWPLYPPGPPALVRCPFPDRRCAFTTSTRWSGELAALLEWRFRDDWSLAGRLSAAQRRELIPELFGSTAPDSSTYMPAWTVTEASFDTVVSWSPTRLLGLSASLALTGALWTNGILERSATVGLSVWLRTDARLQRNWLDL